MIGNYRILKVLGEGGFGRTYLAEHALIKKPVVIKQSLYKGTDAQAITLNEASLLWDVNHWALPTVKDVLTDDENNLLMVMSYIQGEELYKYVRSKGSLDPETVCWITQRILSGLYYLHFNGIVHRDVKPSNIIVHFRTHIATLVDFGLSKLRPDGNPDPCGYTPYFGAPEQIQGKPAIPESDIYSLGVTLIYLLGGDIQSKTLPSNIPDQLKDFIFRLLPANPLQRPKDCNLLNQEITTVREKLFNRKHTM